MDPKYKDIGTPIICLVEECGELLQAISKGDRFGWDNSHPRRTATNLDELRSEWKDLCEAYHNFIEHIEPTTCDCGQPVDPGYKMCQDCAIIECRDRR